MKNKIITLVLVAAAVIGSVAIVRQSATAQTTLNNRTTYRTTSVNAAATTTGNERFMSYGVGTTSLVIDTSVTEQLSILLQGRSSSTAGTFDVWLEGSSNCLDYYPLNYPLAAVSADPATSSVTVAPSKTVFRWIPGTTATSTKGFVLPAIDICTKVSVMVGTSTDITSRGAVVLRVGSR